MNQKQPMPERIIGPSEEEAAPLNEPRKYKNGEVIAHLEDNRDDCECIHGRVIIRRGNKFLLNGKELLYEGDWDSWHAHPDGVVIRKGKQFLLNGKELLYEGNFIRTRPHTDGFIIQTRDNQLLLNGKDPIDASEWDRGFHDKGYLETNRGGDEILLNGELLYKGVFNSYFPHPDGVVIRKGNDFIFYGKSSESQAEAKEEPVS